MRLAHRAEQVFSFVFGHILFLWIVGEHCLRTRGKGWIVGVQKPLGSAVGESGHAGRRDRSPRLTPIRANQIRDVLMRNWPVRNTATPGATSYQATTAAYTFGVW